MNPVILIPARYASSRLPGKPLAEIAGRPMIVHVLQHAEKAEAGDVYVATDSTDIAAAVEAAGGRVVMTAEHHPSGSDRIWEAVCSLDPQGNYDTVINVQGDIPTMPPELVTAVMEPLAEPDMDIATLVCDIENEADRHNPAIVKPVISWTDELRGRALYFSRATVPYGDGPVYHHIGIYAYRREALEKFVHCAPSGLEQREKLEQLRALEYGMTIGVRKVSEAPMGIDTPEQLEALRREMVG